MIYFYADWFMAVGGGLSVLSANIGCLPRATLECQTLATTTMAIEVVVDAGFTNPWDCQATGDPDPTLTGPSAALGAAATLHSAGA